MLLLAVPLLGGVTVYVAGCAALVVVGLRRRRLGSPGAAAAVGAGACGIVAGGAAPAAVGAALLLGWDGGLFDFVLSTGLRFAFLLWAASQLILGWAATRAAVHARTGR